VASHSWLSILGHGRSREVERDVERRCRRKSRQPRLMSWGLDRHSRGSFVLEHGISRTESFLWRQKRKVYTYLLYSYLFHVWYDISYHNIWYDMVCFSVSPTVISGDLLACRWENKGHRRRVSKQNGKNRQSIPIVVENKHFLTRFDAVMTVQIRSLWICFDTRSREGHVPRSELVFRRKENLWWSMDDGLSYRSS